MNCDACEYLSGDFRSVHLIRLTDGCSQYKESLFYVISNSFVSRDLMVSCDQI